MPFPADVNGLAAEIDCYNISDSVSNSGDIFSPEPSVWTLIMLIVIILIFRS